MSIFVNLAKKVALLTMQAPVWSVRQLEHLRPSSFGLKRKPTDKRRQLNSGQTMWTHEQHPPPIAYVASSSIRSSL